MPADCFELAMKARMSDSRALRTSDVDCKIVHKLEYHPGTPLADVLADCQELVWWPPDLDRQPWRSSESLALYRGLIACVSNGRASSQARTSN